MSGEVVHGAVGIEGGVEGKACAHASAFHLTLCIHMSVDVVPCQKCLCTIAFGINPTFVDGMGEAVAVDGGAGGFQIGVGTVEQLMLCAVVMLQGEKPCQMTTLLPKSNW